MYQEKNIRNLRDARNGQSLLEVLVGLGIGALVLGGAVLAISAMLSTSNTTLRSQTASVFSQELMERVTGVTLGNWQVLSSIATGTANHYYLNATGSTYFAVAGEEGMWDADVASGLVAQWKLDEATGTLAYDTSGNKNTAVLSKYAGAVAVPQTAATSTCKSGRCLLFNGQMASTSLANYALAPYSSTFDLTGTALTISAWVYLNNYPVAGNYAGVVRHNGYSSGYRIMLYPSGRILLQVSSSTSVLSTAAVSLGRWVHVVGLYDGAKLQFYIDGNPDTATTAKSNAILASGEGMYLGISTEYSALDGYLDDVRVYNRALSAAEIKRLALATPYDRYFYLEDACRTNDTNNSITTCGGGSVADPATAKITSITEWTSPAARTSAYAIVNYITRWQNSALQQTDWSGGPASSNPLATPNNNFATSTNINYSSSGSIRINGL